MADLMAAEWLKLRKRPVTWWMLGILLALVTAIFLTNFALSRQAQNPQLASAGVEVMTLPLGPQVSFGAASVLFDILLVVLVAVVMGNEYQYGTLRTHLAMGTRRSPYLAAKALTVLLVGLAGLALAVLFGTALATLATLIRGRPLDLGEAFGGDFWRVVGVQLIGTLAHYAIALFVTVLARGVAAGIGVVLGYLLLEGAVAAVLMGLGGVWAQLANLFLGPNLRAIEPGTDLASPLNAGLLPPWAAFAVIAAYIVGFTAISFALFLRRDVKGIG